MKRTAVLSVCVLALAASTVYFARELHALQASEPAALPDAAISAADIAADIAADVAAPVETATPDLASRDSAAAPSTATPAPPAPPASPAEQAKRSRERAARDGRVFLAQYDNPASRAALIENYFVSAQRHFALLQPRVGLDKERWEKFLRLTIDHRLDQRVRIARCAIDPECERPEFPPGYREQQRQRMVDQIGESNVKKYEDFQRDRPPVGSLAKFQARLGPALALPPDQLSELSRALSQEAVRARQELEGRGANARTFELPHGTIVYSADTRTLDERMASASESVRRLRERAGALLDGERLRIFNQLQDDALLTFRRYARSDIAIIAAGYEQ